MKKTWVLEVGKGRNDTESTILGNEPVALKNKGRGLQERKFRHLWGIRRGAHID